MAYKRRPAGSCYSLVLHSFSGLRRDGSPDSSRMLELSTPVQYVKGVGPRIGGSPGRQRDSYRRRPAALSAFRYEDRLNPRGIAELRAGEMATVIGEVRNSGLFRTRSMPIFQLTVGQGRAKTALPLVQRHLSAGQVHARADDRALRQGRSRTSAAASCRSSSRSLKYWAIPATWRERRRKRKQRNRWRSAASSRSMKRTGKLTPRWFRRIIRTALDNLTPDLPDPIPAAVRSAPGLDLAARGALESALA